LDINNILTILIMRFLANATYVTKSVIPNESAIRRRSEESQVTRNWILVQKEIKIIWI